MDARSTRYVRPLLAYRDRTPTIVGVFAASARTYALLAVAFALLTLLAGLVAGAIGAAVVATAFFTTVLRDLGHARHSIRMWPVTREVVDWPKVERLAASGDPTDSTSARG